MPELRECPFCGGAPEVNHLGDNPARGFYISCTNCEVQQIAIHTMDAAAALWNNRYGGTSNG